MENKIGEFREGNDDGVGVGVTGENLNKNHHNLFWADEETGDVFLHQGFKLEPSKHYFITLQVSGKLSHVTLQKLCCNLFLFDFYDPVYL